MSTDPEMIALLSDSARRYAADRYNFLQRHAVLQEGRGYSEKAWQDYAELGWLALRLPESEGGLEADGAAIGAVMEVVGSHLLMEPVLASAIVCAGLLVRLASAEQQARLLPALADGSLKLAFAAEALTLRDNRLNGVAASVLHGDIADQLIVVARDGQGAQDAETLYLVDAGSPGVARQSYRLVDGRGAAMLRFTEAAAERLGAGDVCAKTAVEAVCDEAAVALCAENLGIVKALLERTCEYLKVRQQFGKPIGVNQALQHRAADMYLIREETAALTKAAQRALELPAPERARIVSGAKAYIAHAARRVANEAIQMHGGVGVTEELDVSHYFRRLMVNAELFGSRDRHFARFVERSL
ncbi:MAG: acyl-CoA dehydrogenase family protein [Azonexus sp.]|jgi:alkylation response protein AidB-like acyl-CoA dehydrogenase|nr:acyl-CoA dehydrogenase family protein [Azonexus sp.]